MKPISRISRSASRISLPSFSQPKRPASSRPMKMLRTTDCCTASARSWNTVSMPASRDLAELQPVTNCPRTRMSPEVGCTTPARNLDQSRLPCPVVADEADDLAAPDADIHGPERADAPERLADIAKLDKPFRHGNSPGLVSASPDRTRRDSHPLSHTFGGELGNLPIVIGSYEASAGIHADRRETIDDLLAKPEDWQVSLHERLLIRG